eukprot:320427-Chlamydomonas_euryale.AAC.2
MLCDTVEEEIAVSLRVPTRLFVRAASALLLCVPCADQGCQHGGCESPTDRGAHACSAAILFTPSRKRSPEAFRDAHVSNV